MWDFYQTAFEPRSCWTFILSRLYQPSLISVKLVKTGPGHTKLPAPPMRRRWRLSETEYPPCDMQMLFDVFDIWEQW